MAVLLNRNLSTLTYVESVFHFRSAGDENHCPVLLHCPKKLVLHSRNTRLHIKLPDEIDQKEAALFGLTSVAMRSCRNADLHMGDRLLIVGAGILGQMAAQIAAVITAENREQFDIYVDRSYEVYLGEWLKDSLSISARAADSGH